MCKVRTPSFEAPPEYQIARAPVGTMLTSQARQRVASRSDGTSRQTVLGGLSSTRQNVDTAQRKNAARELQMVPARAKQQTQSARTRTALG